MIGIWSTSIEAIQFDDVRGFCAQQIRENMRLEYKGEFSSAKSSGKKIAKEVAAFANTQGGLIVYGVREVEDRTPEPTPAGEDLGQNPRQRVLSACTDHLFPPVAPEVSEFIQNPAAPSKGFLVVRVAASDEVHTSIDGADIYIRVADQSEPQRASLDTIGYLLGRRNAQIDLQDNRRADAMRRLGTAMNESRDGGLWITVGPRIGVGPLFTLEDLRDKAEGFSIPSRELERWSPIGPRSSLRGALDGVYTIDERGTFGDSAGMIDIFGNVSLYVYLTQPYKMKRCDQLRSERPSSTPAEEEFMDGIMAHLVAEAILTCLRCARNVYRDAGFIGLLQVRVYATQVRGLPLATTHPITGNAQMLAECLGDNHIDIRSSLSTSSVGEDHVLGDAVAPIVHQLIWAWGNTDDQVRPDVIEEAEQAHFGADGCPTPRCNKPKPRNRLLCRVCRAREESEANTAE